MSAEERVINNDLFVPEFKVFLNSLDNHRKHTFIKSIFNNPHAPQNKEDPMVLAILLHLVGMNKERYNICKKYGHNFGGDKYKKEEEAFEWFSRWEQEVHKCFDTKPVNESRVSSSTAKTLPFTAEIGVYINKLHEDYKNAEEPFKDGKYLEYLQFLNRIVEVFQIFKNNLSDTPDEEYGFRVSYV